MKDINDNDPVFPNQNIPIDISEGAQIGSVYRLVSATDADSAKHGIKEYKLNGLGVFELEEETHPDGSIIPSIRLKKELDREEQGTYEVRNWNILSPDLVRTSARMNQPILSNNIKNIV